MISPFRAQERAMGACDFGLLANRMAQSHAVNRVGIKCHDCRISR
jgi:hypothetical protein